MKRVGIIGGGVAGLTAGIYLRKKGIACEIFEKNTVAGGNLTGWRRDDCIIDNCLHWLMGTHRATSLYSLWQDIGMIDKNTVLYRAPYFYMSEKGGRQAAFYASASRTRAELCRLSPEDKREIDRFMDAVDVFRDYYRHGEKMTPKVVSAALYYGCLSLSELAGRMKSPLIGALFTDYIGGDYMALGLLVSYAAFCVGNASVPLGGSPAAAQRITEKFVSLGGKLHTGCEVKQIVVRGKKATGLVTSDGSYHPFDVILCASDPAVTYGRLLRSAEVPRVLKEKRELRFSALHAAFCCDSDMIPHFGTMIIQAEGLEGFGKTRMVVREFSHEPAFAPKGKCVIQCMLLQNNAQSVRWVTLASQKSAAYRRLKELLAGKMARALVLRFPAVTDSLRLLDVWTPATYYRYFGAPCGSFMPWYMPPRRLPVGMSSRVKPYRNVYLVTQWERSPGGVPGAAMRGSQMAGKLT